MSRAVKLDLQADHRRFSNLVDLARGGRTLKQFAIDAGVNQAYLSKVSTPTSTSNVTPLFVMKLANVAENGVSYEELLVSAGFDPTLHPRKEVSKNIERPFSNDYEKGYMAGIFKVRNAVFDIAEAEDASVDKIIYKLCEISVSAEEEKDAEEKALSQGYVVRNNDNNKEYIIISVLADVCVVIGPGGKFQSIKSSKLTCTGHYINAERLEIIATKLSEK